MSDQPVSRTRISNATWIGLFWSIFAILIIRQAVSYFWLPLTFIAALWKESLIWLCAVALLSIVRRGERLPLTSIGIGTSPLWKSILWGLVLTVIYALVGGALAYPLLDTVPGPARPHSTNFQSG